MAVRRRLLASSLAAAVLVGGGIGYLSSRDDDDADVDARLDVPGEVQDPTIGTNRPITGETVPVVTLRDAQGDEVSTASLLGRPLVINVWFSTCVPCKDELPAFSEVERELGDQVRFVGVNPQDPVDVAERFARDLGVDYELLSDPDGELLSAAGITGFPTTLFVGPDGTIVKQHGRALTADALRTIITDELLS